MQLRAPKPKSRRERRKAKRDREQLKAIPIVVVGMFAIVLAAEYENPLILLALAIVYMILAELC